MRRTSSRTSGIRNRRLAGRPSLLQFALPLGLASAFALAANAGCGSARGPVDVIWITWDSTRADHLSSYGYTRPTSPNVAALAEAGVLFETAIAQHNWTKPSYASMLTSLHFWQMPGWALSPDHLTLAEILQQQGYATFGFVQNPNLAAEFHFNQGFDVYERLPDRTSPAEMNELVLSRLDELSASDRPIFLFVHYQGPHYPYREDNPFNGEFVRADEPLLSTRETLDVMSSHAPVWPPDDPASGAKAEYLVDMYDASIRATDEAFGDLVSALDGAGLWDESLVVFNSDHGDELEDRGGYGHAHYNLYPELTFVPLIVRFPERMGVGPARVAASVQNLDVVPTVLDVAGIPLPEHLAGRSVLPLETVGDDPERLAFSNIGGYVAIRSPTRTLVHHYGDVPDATVENGETPADAADQAAQAPARVNQAAQPTADAAARSSAEAAEQSSGHGAEQFPTGALLYDRVADPGERHPLADAANDPAFRSLFARGLQWYPVIVAQKELDAAGATELSEELAQALRALGYLR